MIQLANLDILNLIDQLPRRTAYLELRELGQCDSATLHYNGGKTKIDKTVTAEIEHIRFIAKYHFDKIWGYYKGRPVYGHGIMYAYVVGATGRIYQTRPLKHVLWHCGHAGGNFSSVPVHIPIGDDQRPTPEQWESACNLFEALANYLGYQAKAATFGHKEWASSACPGPVLMPMLEQWRTEPQLIKRYEVVIADSNCREGPGLTFPIALNGTAVYQPGHQFSGRVVQGQTVGGVSEWVHRDDGIGFVNKGLLKEV